MKSALLFLIVLVLLGFIVGCNYDNPASTVMDNQGSNNEMITDDPTPDLDTLYRPLLRSNYTSIGTVKIYNNNQFIYFMFTMNPGYKLAKMKMHANSSIWSFPLTGNCPNLNAFRFQVNTFPPNTTSYLYQVSTTSILATNAHMYAAIYVEAESTANEPDCITAWAKGTRFPGCSGDGMHFRKWIPEIKVLK